MMFTSGTQALQGRSVNRDPLPWVWSEDEEKIRFAPRVEFGVSDNPVLAKYRDDIAGAPMGENEFQRDDYKWLLDEAWEETWSELSVTEDQVVHARKVIGRLEGWEE